MIKGFSGQPWLDRMKGKYPVHDDLSLAGQLRIPVLIVIGKKDMLSSPLAFRLHEIISNSRLKEIPGAGHMVNMEKPGVFNDLLEEFLINVDKESP